MSSELGYMNRAYGPSLFELSLKGTCRARRPTPNPIVFFWGGSLWANFDLHKSYTTAFQILRTSVSHHSIFANSEKVGNGRIKPGEPPLGKKSDLRFGGLPVIFTIIEKAGKATSSVHNIILIQNPLVN